MTSDLIKTLGEWAVAAGRQLQSAQTGYVHDYHGDSRLGAQTIPLVENALFVLALLRTRLVEQIQEAKGLLTGLLAFQNLQGHETHGNFPVYLHEYPNCRDTTVGLQLLAPFYWMYKHFGHVLGSHLKQQLEQSICLILEYSLQAHQNQPFPYSFAVRLAAAQFSYGSLLQRPDWQQKGKEQLEELSQRQLEGWYTTGHLGDLLIGLQMAYPSLVDSPWKQLWERMEQTWHHQTGCYMGPCLSEWQEGEEPRVNVYDLYAGYFAGQFSRRATLLRSCHLYAALVHPSIDKFHPRSDFHVEGEWRQQSWQTICHPKWAYTVLEKKENLHTPMDKTATPFRFIWGDLHRMHSFVCQGGSYEKVEYILEKDAIHLIFDLKEQTAEDRAPQREIEFFADFHPDISFTLNGHAANTFELDQRIIFSLGEHQLSLMFELLQGEGHFLGHLMRGNRPLQISQKNDKRFHSYDWTLFLRTIRRQGPCRIKATIQFE